MSNYVNLLDIVYPVGSVFISNNSVSPADFIGGTWTKLDDDTFVCCGTPDTTGGANSVTLTVNQMPSHGHTIWWSSVKEDGTIQDLYWDGKGLAKAPNTTWGGKVYSGDSNNPIYQNGGDKPFDNRPKYRAFNIYFRTA